MVRCCEVSEDVKASALTRPTHEFSTHGAQGRQRSASHTPRGGHQQGEKFHEAIVIKANMATSNGAGTKKISKSKPINFTLMAASSFLAGCRSLVFGLCFE